MKVAIHQPNFLPWPGFFHKWRHADCFVLLDTVQFEKNEFQNRNRIKTAHGVRWLTVPVHYRFPMRIVEVKIVPGPWPRKHRRTIEESYRKAAAFAEVWPTLAPAWDEIPEDLCAFNIRLLRLLGDWLDCRAPLVRASELGVDDPDPTQRLVRIVQAVGGTEYLAGAGGRNYMRLELFAEAGIRVRFQQVEVKPYPQCHGAFVPYLSALDLLLNLGRDAAQYVRKMGDFA
ncbi:MAG: hypothetical protein D6771_03960 [Zetaproteobacteria bacterium]|nr:MAG: hypothetical protein D6771_03960 [Zetaproteobacteria bacterium]